MPDSEQNNRLYIKNSNVTDWIQIGGFLIAAQLTIIALIWQAKPTDGIYTVTLLLMISFAFFVNSVFSNSKANFLVKLINCDDEDEKDKKIYTQKFRRIEKFGYYTFNIAYSFSIVGFTLLAYKYMIDFIGRQLIVVLLPIIFIVVIWMLLVVYTIAKSPINVVRELFEPHKIIGVLIELVCLIIIVFDFRGDFIIP
ncbi:MAG: hypothetical protein ACFE96_09980 [Candidatus Hermodarchaeota archaeon]